VVSVGCVREFLPMTAGKPWQRKPAQKPIDRPGGGEVSMEKMETHPANHPGQVQVAHPVVQSAAQPMHHLANHPVHRPGDRPAHHPVHRPNAGFS
jgi:hypothetical protein